MKHLTLERFLPSVHGTFGVMQVGNFVFFTLEEEWKDDEGSCIPADTYEMRLAKDKSGFLTYEIVDVPGVGSIKFHRDTGTQGCILLGMRLGVFVVTRDEETGGRTRKLAVLKSHNAFTRFMENMKGAEKATIEISWGKY